MIKDSNFAGEVSYYRTPPAETPYKRAKQIWDRRLGRYATSADIWRKIALICMMLIILLFILLLLSFSWHKPKLFVAEVSAAGQVMNVQLLAMKYQPTQAQEEYFISQFVELVRSLPLDPVAAKNNWLKAYAFLSDRGAHQLNQLFKDNNPLPDLSKKTITVSITDINPLGKNTYHIDWDEQAVDQNGHIVEQRQMSGLFTVMIKQPTNEDEMLSNPLGIYIIDFHISPRLSATSVIN